MKQQPKIDLHCHLDGSLNVALVRRFLQEEGEEHACAELEAQMRAPADCPSLADYLARFALPIRCLQTRAHLCAAAETLAADAAAEGVVYLEVRFAPSFCTQGGLSVRDTIESVQEGLARAERAHDIRTGIIVCGMRHMPMETNLAMLRAARGQLGAGVVACDLAGDERAWPNALFGEFFALAKQLDMPCTIHSGECGSAENVRAAVEMGARRLGHGIAMAADPALMRLCAAKGIGAELCPTSNFQTKAATAWADYPLRAFLAAGVPVSLNTDNRTVSGTTSTREWALAVQHCALTEEEQAKIYRSSVEMAFAPDDVKQRLLQKWGE